MKLLACLLRTMNYCTQALAEASPLPAQPPHFPVTHHHTASQTSPTEPPLQAGPQPRRPSNSTVFYFSTLMLATLLSQIMPLLR